MQNKKLIYGGIVVGLGLLSIAAVLAFTPNDKALLERILENNQREYAELQKEKENIEALQEISHLEAEAIRAKLDFITASSQE